MALTGDNLVTQTYDDMPLTIAVDKNGTPFLAVFDTDPTSVTYGNLVKLVDFEFSTTSDKSVHAVTGTGLNPEDPTGNTLRTTYGSGSSVKPFYLANLIKYADILVYHLVMAHQHSLDYADTGLTTDQLTGVSSNGTPTGVNSRLVEFLRYWEKLNNVGAGAYINANATATNNKPQDGINDDTTVKTLLKQKGTLRNFLSYPVEDQEVSRIGIGNRPQLPWYMKRQFCNYYMYQKDVMRSVVNKNDPIVVTKNGVDYNVWVNEAEGITDTLAVNTTPADPANWYKACNVTWKSLFDVSYWSTWDESDGEDVKYTVTADDVTKWGNGLEAGQVKKKTSGYTEALGLQGHILDKLYDCHHNRKVIIDVVYEVNTNQFRFADKGRNTTAWYSMMTNNENDGLMNFSYLHSVGARLDRTHHYTNNYLWAPEGDPYGFVLRSRYATINGTGWDDVAITTKGHLPKSTNDATSGELTASYTSQVDFKDKRIIHQNIASGAATDGPDNAVYEMFVGGYDDSFLMHPTSAWMDNDDATHETYYMKHQTAGNTTELTKTDSKTLLTDRDANWKLVCTSEQLIPYFKRSGYVGGLQPLVAQNFTNVDYYDQLQQSIASGTPLSFSTLRKIQELVYGGTFYKKDGITVVAEGSDRPAASELPMTFKSTNLVNMTPGYYRIKAFSEDALNTDGEDLAGDGSNIKGIVGPRYISGYRFESEKTDQYDEKNSGGRWLHFLETDMTSSTIHTYGNLLTKIGEVDTQKGGTSDRDQISHPAMRGNIEILPADFDPSSIFQFTKATSATSGYEVYRLGTQGLKLWARPGTSEVDATTGTHQFGRTELVESTPSAAEGYGTAGINWSQDFRLADIGGAAMTLRTLKQETGNWDADVAVNLKTNYVCIDRNHRYRITCHTDNEMVEIGDHYTTDGLNGIQDTKWLLQPVGTKEEWPYNEMPLRVEVQKGGVGGIRQTSVEGHVERAVVVLVLIVALVNTAFLHFHT